LPKANAPSVSVARTLRIGALPAALSGGIPLSVLPLRLNQEGRLEADHVRAPVPPVAANDTLYGEAGIAGGSGEVVVMVTGGFTVTDNNCARLMAPAWSVTLTSSEYGVAVATTGAVPVTEGPLTVSHEATFVPFQTSGGVPPLAERPCEYGNPDVVGGSDVVVTDGNGLTGRVKICGGEDEERLSVAVMVNEKVPADGGVPLSRLPFNVSHEGRVTLEKT
jgi:hypothetical protein